MAAVLKSRSDTPGRKEIMSKILDYKLISDSVKDMTATQMAHNQFFIKDGEAWYRDFEREISCRNLAREIAVKMRIWKSIEEYGEDADTELIDDEIFDETMMDSLFYATERPEGILSMYYTAMWGMAEVREWYKESLQDPWIVFEMDSNDILVNKMPEDEQDVIVTDGKNVWCDTFMRDGWECYFDSGYEIINEIKAWQPLPAPYKNGDQ